MASTLKASLIPVKKFVEMGRTMDNSTVMMETSKMEMDVRKSAKKNLTGNVQEGLLLVQTLVSLR